MKKILICLTLSLLTFLTGNSYALDGNEPDTIPSDFENQQIVNNLDSLLNLWYVNHSLKHTTDEFITTEEDSTINYPEFSDSVYKERLSKIPSLFPLSYNEKVRMFINAYTKKHRKQVEVMLSLSNYYFPIFEEILDSYDMPLELKYLSIIESALNPNAVSRAGATGLWQFMYSTGKLYKLTITTFVDDRRDPIKSTQAAARFLKDLYAIYHDWPLVIAAYNCGPGNVNKAIRRANGKNNYWEIYNFLPKETRGYVPAYIAATYVMTYYKEHNIVPKKIDYPMLVDTITISEDLHLGQVSEVLKIPVDLLRDLNPQYKKDIIPAKTCGNHPLRLPIEYTNKFIELDDSILAFKDSLYFNIKSSDIPVMYANRKPFVPTQEEIVYYTVKSGDNLAAIAKWFRVSATQLKDWNNLRKKPIKRGQKLAIYVPSVMSESYKKLNTMSLAQKQNFVPKAKPVVKATDTTGAGLSVKLNATGTDSTGVTNSLNNADTTHKATSLSDKNFSADSLSASDIEYYTIRNGDTLSSIAKRFPGVTNKEIMELNNISNANHISPGQVIKIKKKS